MNTSLLANQRTHNTIQRADIGQTIYYYAPKEAGVTRDSYRDIVGVAPTPVKLKAFPIILNPGQRVLERCGMKQGIKAIFEVSIIEWQQKIGKEPPDIVRHKIGLILGKSSYVSIPGFIIGVNLIGDQTFLLGGRFDFVPPGQRNFIIDDAHYTGTLNEQHRNVLIGCVEET